MKFLKFIAGGLLAALSISEASAQQGDKFVYFGARETSFLAAQIVLNNVSKPCGSLIYDTTRAATQGVGAMKDGVQDTSLMIKPFTSLQCAQNPNARQIIIAGDRMPVLINSGNEKICDLKLTRDVPNYSSSVPRWAEALQLVYGGANGAGDRAACLDSNRANLVNNWPRLWEDACPNGNCPKLRFAFRQGDDDLNMKVFKRIIGVQNFCNGAQNEDNDPLRTDCSKALDVDWCPDGTLGVVQAIALSRSLPVYPRVGCVRGQFKFTLQVAGEVNCVDGTSPFAGFLCPFPVNCRGEFGCINSYRNGPYSNPFMDGREYNKLMIDKNLKRITIPENASPSFIYFNGKCTGGNTGTRSEDQVGCLVNQVKCSITVATPNATVVPVTNLEVGEKCTKEFKTPSRMGAVNGYPFAKQGSGYPMTRPVYYGTLNIPVVNDQFDCSKVNDPDERLFCQCVFDKPFLDGRISVGINESVAQNKLLECGAQE